MSSFPPLRHFWAEERDLQHKGTKLTEKEINTLSHEVIGAAIEVHKVLGPGLLESAYEEWLAHELSLRGLRYALQVPLPVVFKGIRLDCGYRMDMVVQGQLILELKAVERILPIHEVQLLTYLRLSGKWLGLLLNFHSARLQDGIRRRVNGFTS